MIIDLRKDAPDQTDNVDPEKLSQEVEKLKSVQNQIQNLEAQIKDLKEDEKYF
jgi:cell division protein FtsB